jgi:hypothetical protein
MLRQLLASWMILACLSLSASSCALRNPDSGTGDETGNGRAVGDPAGNPVDAAAGVAKEGSDGVAASSASDDADGAEAANRASESSKKGSGAAAELEDGWELLAVEKVTVHARGDRWHIEVQTSTRTAGWKVELRQRKPAGTASQSAYTSEFLLVGKKPEEAAASVVTSMKAETNVTLDAKVSTLIVTGQNAGGEQSIIEEVPRTTSN